MYTNTNIKFIDKSLLRLLSQDTQLNSAAPSRPLHPFPQPLSKIDDVIHVRYAIYLLKKHLETKYIPTILYFEKKGPSVTAARSSRATRIAADAYNLPQYDCSLESKYKLGQGYPSDVDLRRTMNAVVHVLSYFLSFSPLRYLYDMYKYRDRHIDTFLTFLLLIIERHQRRHRRSMNE